MRSNETQFRWNDNRRNRWSQNVSNIPEQPMNWMETDRWVLKVEDSFWSRGEESTSNRTIRIVVRRRDPSINRCKLLEHHKDRHRRRWQLKRRKTSKNMWEWIATNFSWLQSYVSRRLPRAHVFHIQAMHINIHKRAVVIFYATPTR